MLIIILAGIAVAKYVSKNKKASVISMRNKNKHKLFFIFVFLLFILTLMLPSQEVYAQVFFSEDWDNGTPNACWPCKTIPCSSSFNGWTQGTEVLFPQVGLSTTQAHSGTRSFYQYRPSGSTGSCDINHVFSTPYPSTIYLRFYLYMTSNWNTSETDNASWMHWIFTNTRRANTSFRMNMVTNREWGLCPLGAVCILPEGDGGVQWWNTSWPAGINLKSIIGAWTCFEYKMQISGSNIVLTEWINGAQTRGPITGPGQDATGNFHDIAFSGWENTGANYTADHYIDDIVVADSYIGCNGGGGDTPPPPSGGSSGDASASGGSGCGFVKEDNGKGQGAKGEGLLLMIMLVITLTIVYLIRRSKVIRRFYDDTTNKV
jgi:hypothetical protein